MSCDMSCDTSCSLHGGSSLTCPCSVQCAPTEDCPSPHDHIGPGTMQAWQMGQPSHCRAVQSPSSQQMLTKKSGFASNEALSHTLPTTINPQNSRWGHELYTKEDKSTHSSCRQPCLSEQHTMKITTNTPTKVVSFLL